MAISHPIQPLPVSFSHSQLVYFVRVAEEGQISRAARTLHIAQPALSQAIGRLERQLGLELLRRHPRGVSLTDSGEVFLSKARAAVAAGQDAAAAARSLARGDKGTVQIGFLTSPPPLSAPQLLEQFAAAHPDVEVSFRELPFPTLPASEWLAEVDVAICHAPVRADGVECRTLWNEALAALLLRSHPLAARSHLLVKDVVGERFYGYHPDVDPRWASFWTLDDHRGGPPELTGDAPANAMELVAALTSGRGISTGPYSIARTVTEIVPQLVAVPIRDATPASCELIWRTPPQNPLTSAFVEAAG
jgi:DNA-binding transcriptional LysR family regulator